jgi:hypothetical protein
VTISIHNVDGFMMDDNYRQQWVSPVQVMPKKRGMTIVKNEKNELIPQRTITGWRMCIDYQKLIKATKKDHFLLPFIDEMLERLTNHSFFCFLDGYSVYHQITIKVKLLLHVHMELMVIVEYLLDYVMLQLLFKDAKCLYFLIQLKKLCKFSWMTFLFMEKLWMIVLKI